MPRADQDAGKSRNRELSIASSKRLHFAALPSLPSICRIFNRRIPSIMSRLNAQRRHELHTSKSMYPTVLAAILVYVTTHHGDSPSFNSLVRYVNTVGSSTMQPHGTSKRPQNGVRSAKARRKNSDPTPKVVRHWYKTTRPCIQRKRRSFLQNTFL